MKRTLSIRIKATFLLVVFSLNMIIGFACSIGIDMGFNSHHHDEEVAEIMHVHSDGKKHFHKAAQAINHNNNDSRNGKDNCCKDKDGKDNCCKDKVTKLTQLDKSLPQTYSIHPIFLAAFTSAYYEADFSNTIEGKAKTNLHVRSCYHPTISDIRIAIQSFQI